MIKIVSQFIELHYYHKGDKNNIQIIRNLILEDVPQEFHGETLLENLEYGYIIKFHDIYVGFIGISWEDEFAVFIKKDWQRMGIATLALSLLAKIDKRKLMYYIDRNNDAALLLEKKLEEISRL